MNKEFLDKFEETKRKIKELSDDELTKVSGGDNPAGQYMYEIGTKFCWSTQFNAEYHTVFEIKNRYVIGIQNMYDCDIYVADRNGNMLDTPYSLPIEERYFEDACIHKGMMII